MEELTNYLTNYANEFDLRTMEMKAAYVFYKKFLRDKRVEFGAFTEEPENGTSVWCLSGASAFHQRYANVLVSRMNLKERVLFATKEGCEAYVEFEKSLREELLNG